VYEHKFLIEILGSVRHCMKQLENNYLLPASLLFCLEDGGGRLHLSVETDLLNYSVLHYR